MKNTTNVNLLNATALVIVLCCAIGSLYFVVDAGRNNSSLLLKALFVIWVLLPFIALLIVNKFSTSWSSNVRTTSYWLMIILPIVSLFFYSGVFKIQGTKTAFVFLITPLLSLLILMVFVLLSKRQSHNL